MPMQALEIENPPARRVGDDSSTSLLRSVQALVVLNAALLMTAWGHLAFGGNSGPSAPAPSPLDSPFPGDPEEQPPSPLRPGLGPLNPPRHDFPGIQEYPSDFIGVKMLERHMGLFFFKVPRKLVDSEHFVESDEAEAAATPADMMITATFADGPMAHFPVGVLAEKSVFRWVLSPDQTTIKLVAIPVAKYTTNKDYAHIIRRSRQDSTIASCKIAEVTKDSVTFDASAIVASGFGIAGVGMGAEVLEKPRVFPQNIDFVIRFDLGEKNTAVRFCVARLPEKPMASRYADDRIGFFYSLSRDYGDHRADKLHGFDPPVRRINRQHPPEPGKPITYHVDPTVPTKWRAAVKDGVELWKKAFKEAGYGDNAIRALVPGDKDWPEDYNSADIRFNSISWALGPGGPGAMAEGLSIVDPRSGETLKATIVFTLGWLQVWKGELDVQDVSTKVERMAQHTERQLREWDISLPVGSQKSTLASRLAQAQMPQSLNKVVTENARATCHHEAKASDRFGIGLHLHVDCKGPLCVKPEEVLEGVCHSSGSLSSHSPMEGHLCRELDDSPALTVLAGVYGQHGAFTDKMAKMAISEVSVHEVGHTLGLRHNFRGSLSGTLSSAQGFRKTSSVMDYVPLAVGSQDIGKTLDEDAELVTTSVGEYDIWAIRYGYENFYDEDHAKKVAAEEPGFEFATDEDDSSIAGEDPTTNVYDIGNPLDYWADRIELVRQVRGMDEGVIERSKKFDEPFKRSYVKWELVLLNSILNSVNYLGKYFGGTRYQKLRGDPMEPIPFEEQLKAVETMCSIFEDESLLEDSVGLPSISENSTEIENGLNGESNALLRARRTEQKFNLFPSSQDLPHAVKTCCEPDFAYGSQSVDIMALVEKVLQAVLMQFVNVARLQRLQSRTPLNGMPKNATAILFSKPTAALFGQPLRRSKLQAPRLWQSQMLWAQILNVVATQAQALGLWHAAFAASYDVTRLTGELKILMQGELRELRKIRRNHTLDSTALAEVFHVETLLQMLGGQAGGAG